MVTQITTNGTCWHGDTNHNQRHLLLREWI